MRQTYPEAVFDFIDTKAKKDSTASSDTVQPFCDLALLKNEDNSPDYGTLELNQFVLDGSKVILADNSQPSQDIAFLGNTISGTDSSFPKGKEPKLTISFTQPHSSVGITLRFAGTIPKAVELTWYTLYGTKLITKVFYPDRNVYFCSANVQNYGKIAITFLGTSFPCRYAGIDFVKFGRRWPLSRETIKSASVYEELDPTSAVLSINTASMEIVDTEGNFVLADDTGLWNSLQKEQEIQLTEHIGGEEIDCGTFFLDDWSSQKNIIKFSLIDRIGVMDKTDFYNGRIYDKVPAGELIREIMSSCGVEKYSVEEEIYNTPLSGWLGIQSHRSALQQVVFACGAVADCSRSDWIRIYQPEQYVSHTVGLDRKFIGTKISRAEYISDVTVSYTGFSLSEESSQISNGELPAGRTRIAFSEPYLPESITVSAGTILEASVNYVVIEMTEAAECLVQGRKYEAVENAYTASVELMEAGETARVKNFKGCTLMNQERARKTAEYILDFYQKRQLTEMKYINDGEAVGNWCDIALSDGGYATGAVLSQTLDLSGGNIGTVKCRGIGRTVTSFFYTGSELYAGEEGLI